MALPGTPPCFEFLNSEFLEAGEGRAKLRFRPTLAMANPFGRVQGGVLAGMVDNVVGVAVFSMSEGKPTSTIQLSMNYLRPAALDRPIVGNARVVKAGKMQLFIQATLEDEETGSTLVAATTVHLWVE